LNNSGREVIISPAGSGDWLGYRFEHIGLRRLAVIHLNDSKAALGARIDRHEHLGKGTIGKAGIKRMDQLL